MVPNYDYYCQACEVDFEAFAKIAARSNVKHECGTLAMMVFHSATKPIVFRAGFFPHLDKNPVYAANKQQLKDECNKRDKFMPYAWD